MSAEADGDATAVAEQPQESAAGKFKNFFGSAAEKIKEASSGVGEKLSGAAGSSEGLKVGAASVFDRVRVGASEVGEGASGALAKAKKASSTLKEDIRAKIKGSAVFGVDLGHILARDGNLLYIPRVVEKCTTYLEDRGADTTMLFQLSGNQAQVDSYKKAMDTDDMAADVSGCGDPHVIAQLLRLYFVSLPEPLIPDYERFLAAEGGCSRRGNIRPCISPRPPRLTPGAQPQSHQGVLRHMLLFLHKIATDATRHGANARVCAVAFGPAWLRTSSVERTLYDLPLIVKVTERLITKQEEIFLAVDAASSERARQVAASDEPTAEQAATPAEM